MKRRWVLNLLSQFLFNLGSNEGKIDFTGGKLANTLGLKAGVFGGFNKTQADIFGSTLSGAVTTPANIIADKATEKTHTMNKNKLTGLTIVLVFGAIISFIMFRHKQLETRGVLLNAKMIEWVMGANVGMDLKYEFYYEGKKITGTNATGNYRGNPLFVNKYFPVMFDLCLCWSSPKNVSAHSYNR